MPNEMPDPRLEEVSEDVFAYIQPDGTWFLNNTGFLRGRRGVTVIDQCGTEERARRFQETVAQTCEPPVQTLINTHHHGDHTFGNFVAPRHTTIVAHRKARDEVIATGTSIAAAFEGPEWGEIEILPPFLCFEDRLTLFVDELECHLIHFGTPAHTTNDVVVWIPERKLLFAGDLAFKGGTPFALQGSIDGWIETIGAIKGLGAETIVPGHGPVCGPEVFDAARDYLLFLRELAKQGFEAGIEPLELAQSTDLGKFADLSDAERIVGNLYRAYSELRDEERGIPLDLASIMGEMRTYLGGPILSHA